MIGTDILTVDYKAAHIIIQNKCVCVCSFPTVQLKLGNDKKKKKRNKNAVVTVFIISKSSGDVDGLSPHLVLQMKELGWFLWLMAEG